MSVKITAHPLRPAAWQLETTALLKLGCWVTSSRGGNGKVEATSMRLGCKLIHPPPHFLPHTRAALVFRPNLQ